MMFVCRIECVCVCVDVDYVRIAVVFHMLARKLPSKICVNCVCKAKRHAIG